MSTAAPAKKPVAHKPIPVPNGDVYQLVELLTPEEKATVHRVRTFLDAKVRPIINKYWSDDAFPFEVVPFFKDLRIGGLGFEGYGCAGGSQKLFGFVAMEIAGVDASICTFFGAHSRLAMGSIYLDGSDEQKKKWLPAMARWEKIGCFGLTEPLVGSGTSGGMTTTAKRGRRHRKVAAKRAPELGEHNDDILRQLGFNATEIDALRASGAVPKAKEHAA